MKSRIGVVGAGLMGGEIALVFALAGHNVRLSDRDEATLDRAMARLRTLMKKGVDRSFYTADQVESTLERIVPTLDVSAFADVDVATEAVFESLEVKTEVLKSLDATCRPGCLIATNTSTIPISTLAACLPPERRNRFVGMHYFSPVSRIKLVEVISGFETEGSAIEEAMRLALDAGKTPIRVKDVAGFAVNRMLHMLIIEAVKLVEEGVATPEDIDTACKLGLGHPIGPFALMDAVTSSLCVQAQEIMQEAYGERFRPPPLLKQRVRAGLSGGKGLPGWLGPRPR